MSIARAPAADVCTMEEFGPVMNEPVKTLDLNGKETITTCYNALLTAGERTNQLQERMRQAIALEGRELKTRVQALGNELDVLQLLAVKTLELSNFFKENTPKFAFSEDYKRKFPCAALHFERSKGWHVNLSGEIDQKHQQFSSWLGDRGGYTSSYLMDTWSQLKAKDERQ